MFLENLLCKELSSCVREMIFIVVSQINMLLCLVNDILDLKLIEENKFVAKKELFQPREIFGFISSMFQQ